MAERRLKNLKSEVWLRFSSLKKAA